MSNSAAMSGGQWADAVLAQKQKAAAIFGDEENPMDTATGGGRKTTSLIGVGASLPPLETDEERAWEAQDIKDLKRTTRVEQVGARARAAAKAAGRAETREQKKAERRANGGFEPGNKEGNTVLDSLKADGDEFRPRRASGTTGRTPGMVGIRDEIPGMISPDAVTTTTDLRGSTKQDALHTTDVDSADNRKAYRVSSSSSGSVNTSPSSFEGRIAQRNGYAEGKLYIEAAGRCNHPRCQQLREKGLHLMGALTRFQGVGVESPLAEIPSIPVDEKVYPVVNGKKDPKNAQSVRTYKPADRTHPEWVARGGNNPRMNKPGMQLETNPEAMGMYKANPDAMRARNPVKPGKDAPSDDHLAYRQAKWEQEFSDPTSLLQHHHFEGDDDFVAHPLPWEQ